MNGNSTSSPSTPFYRPSGRVILADGDDRILLIRIEDMSIGDNVVLWVTPGGACEGTESFRDAARRELAEETGLRVAELGPCVWRRHHVWQWGDRTVDTHEEFYFLRITDPVEIVPVGASDLELGVIKEYRWWSLAELEAAAERQDSTREELVPRGFPELVAPLLRGEFPAEPIDSGI